MGDWVTQTKNREREESSTQPVSMWEPVSCSLVSCCTYEIRKRDAHERELLVKGALEACGDSFVK